MVNLKIYQMDNYILLKQTEGYIIVSDKDIEIELDHILVDKELNEWEIFPKLIKNKVKIIKVL